MLPTLAEIFGEPIPAYFTLLLIGFAFATWLAARLAKKDGIDPHTFIDLGLFCVIFGVLGARLLHVFVDGYFWDYVHLCTDPSKVTWEITAAQCQSADGIWDAMREVCQPLERDCFAWAAFWRGGLTYYGGLVAASIFGIWFLKREGVRPTGMLPRRLLLRRAHRATIRRELPAVLASQRIPMARRPPRSPAPSISACPSDAAL